MDVSVSAGDLLQMDGTLDESVLIGDKFPPPKARRYKMFYFVRYNIISQRKARIKR